MQLHILVKDHQQVMKINYFFHYIKLSEQNQ